MVNKPVVKNVLGTRQLILCTSLLPQALDTRQTHTIPFPISPPLYTAPSPRCTLYPPLPPSALHTHSACHDCPGVCMYVLTRVPGPPTGVTRLGSPASPLMVPVDATCLPGLSRSGGSKPLPSPGGGRTQRHGQICHRSSASCLLIWISYHHTMCVRQVKKSSCIVLSLFHVQ